MAQEEHRPRSRARLAAAFGLSALALILTLPQPAAAQVLNVGAAQTVTVGDTRSYSGGTIGLFGIFDVTNSATVDNTGALGNGGTINNAGIFTNSSTGSITNATVVGTINNTGLLGNYGTIDNDGTVTNGGGLINYGTLLNGYTFTNNAFFTNADTGTVTNNALFFKNNAVIINLGAVANNSIMLNAGTFLNGGTFKNTSNFNNTGVFDNSSTVINTSSFSNTGSIKNSGVFHDNGGIINFHTIVNTGTLVSGNLANMSGGTLKIGTGGTGGVLSGHVANDGSVIFNRSDASSYGGVISGTGTLGKQGSGALTLSGHNTYTGATTVEAGTLLVNGAIAGSATEVKDGATLGGSGDLGGVTVQGGGFFAPGNSIGSNTATSFDLKSGATFAVQISGGGFTAGTNNDTTNVSGAATLENGAIIDVTPDPAGSSAYTLGRYTILTANTLSVGALTLNEHFAFLDFTYGFDASSLWLDSVLASAAPSFCLSGSSANQCATGKGVFSLGAGGALYRQFLGMTKAQALAAQNALSGEVHASAQSVFIEGAGLIRNAALARLRESFDQYGGNDTVILGYAPEAFRAPSYQRHPAVWAQGFGATGEMDGNDNAADLDSHEVGVLGGVEGFVAEDWWLGLLAGYSRTDFDVDDRDSSGDSDNLHLGLYGGTEFGNLGLRAGLVQSWHWVDSKRQALGQTLKADYDARTFQAFTELGYRFDHHTFWFEPFAGLAYVRHHTEAFSESGGSAALDVEESHSDTGFTTLGARAAADVMLGRVAATLRGSAGWRHAFGDKVPESVNAFAGGAGFTVEGTPIAEDAAVLEAGLDLRASETVTLGLSYAGQFSADARNHSGHAKVTVVF